MPSVTIHDISTDSLNALKAAAAARHRTLASYLRDLLLEQTPQVQQVDTNPQTRTQLLFKKFDDATGGLKISLSVAEMNDVIEADL